MASEYALLHSLNLFNASSFCSFIFAWRVATHLSDSGNSSSLVSFALLPSIATFNLAITSLICQTHFLSLVACSSLLFNIIYFPLSSSGSGLFRPLEAASDSPDDSSFLCRSTSALSTASTILSDWPGVGAQVNGRRSPPPELSFYYIP